MNLIYVNATNIFLKKLKNIEDQEKKRKIIGSLFIEIFKKYSKKIKNVKLLEQETHNPDLITHKTVIIYQTL